MRVTCLLITCGLGAALTESTAAANGRYPRAERLLEDPANPQRLIVSATYGLLETNDGGKDWYHVCEAAFAQPGYEGDPLIDFASGSALLVDAQAAIARSADGCAFTDALGQRSDGTTTTWVDFAVERSRGEIIVAVANRSLNGRNVIELAESTDGAVTWSAIGQPLPLTDVYTVDLAPGDPAHIYASGLEAAGEGGGASVGVLLESTDHGTTWVSHPIAAANVLGQPYIAAVDPRNPRALFVRTDHVDVNAEGGAAPNDALLYSGDAGATWRELIRKHAKLLGFALSPDGSRVLAGYGNPDASPSIDPSQLGIFEASTANWSFVNVYGGTSVTCLTWTNAGTYVCTALGASRSFEQLAFFPNGTLGAATTPVSLMQFGDVRGPPPCCDAVASLCAWSLYCSLFAACDDASDAPPICDASADDAVATADPLGDGAGATADGTSADLETMRDGASSVDAKGDDSSSRTTPDIGPTGGHLERGHSANCACDATGGVRDQAWAAGLLGLGVLGTMVRRARREKKG